MSTGSVAEAPLKPIVVPLWAWLALAAALGLLVAVTVDNGLLLRTWAEHSHEFFHDARHLVGVPCH